MNGVSYFAPPFSVFLLQIACSKKQPEESDSINKKNLYFSDPTLYETRPPYCFLTAQLLPASLSRCGERIATIFGLNSQNV